MLKKIFAVVIAAALVLALATTALAAQYESDGSRPDYSSLTGGIRLNIGGPAAGGFIGLEKAAFTGLTDDYQAFSQDFDGFTVESSGYFVPSPSVNDRPLDLSGIIDPAPESVYYSNADLVDTSFIFNGLKAGGEYFVRIHSNGSYFWNDVHVGMHLEINGTVVYDKSYYQDYGGANGDRLDIGITKEFKATADSAGLITLYIDRATGTEWGFGLSGIEVIPLFTETAGSESSGAESSGSDSSSGGKDVPVTGDNSMLPFCAVMFAFSAIGAAVLKKRVKNYN